MDIEQVMEKICDCCHWPYVEADQDALDARCECCTIEKDVMALRTEESII